MDLQRFAIKIFAHEPYTVEQDTFIEVFHGWIRDRALADDLVLVDVADYRHVPEGPGVMLISHEINFAMDEAGGRFGLYAQRKQPQEGNLAGRLAGLVRDTARFGSLLEEDWRVAGKLTLDPSRIEFYANDRLVAPNSDEAWKDLEPVLTDAARSLFGDDADVERVSTDPRNRLQATLRTSGNVALADLHRAAMEAAA